LKRRPLRCLGRALGLPSQVFENHRWEIDTKPLEPLGAEQRVEFEQIGMTFDQGHVETSVIDSEGSCDVLNQL